MYTKRPISVIFVLSLFFVMTSGNVSVHALKNSYASANDTLILPSASPWGTGADGDLTVSSGQTIYTDNTRSALAASAASGQPSLTLSSPSGFSVGQDVLVVQMQGTDAGNYEFGTITNIASNTLTLSKTLSNAYTVGGNSKAQAIRVMQYQNVTVQNGGELTAHSWNGGTGGLIVFRTNGTLTVSGTLTVTGLGFRGGQPNYIEGGTANQGESSDGIGTQSRSANGSGGGGATKVVGSEGAGGGGGGHSSTGTNGTNDNSSQGGAGGNPIGQPDLVSSYLGSGGGGGTGGSGGSGSAGGGAAFISARVLSATSIISTNGDPGVSVSGDNGGGGGGAGGSFFLRVQSATFASIFAVGGPGGADADDTPAPGGAGSDGRIRIEYGHSVSGTTNPPASVYHDPTLDTHTISGNAGLAGVTLSYTDGKLKTATSDSGGNYSLAVSYNWSGKITPSKPGFSFFPASRTYTNVVANQINQNYSAHLTISGNAGDAGVILHYANGTAKTVTSSSNGHYSFSVPYHWSGTVTPTKSGVTFSPASRSYSHLATSQTRQNYSDKVSFISTAAYDGGIIESAQGSGVGDSMNSTDISFPLGDDSHNRQFRLILSFSTASLPDTAIIQSAVLKIKQGGSPVGINPFSALGDLVGDIRKGYFGLSPALELTDFNAAATAAKISSFGSTPVSGWYSASFNATGRSDVNKTGLTQLKLRFSLPTNNNNLANYMVFFSGNAAVGSRPLLIITYSMP